MLKREELDEIALKVAEHSYNAPCITSEAHLSEMKHFAHALLCKVQKRMEVVGYRHTFGDFTQVIDLDEVEKANFRRSPNSYEPLTTLPLIEE